MKIIKFKDFFIKSTFLIFPNRSLENLCRPEGCRECCFKGFCMRTLGLFTPVTLAKK